MHLVAFAEAAGGSSPAGLAIPAVAADDQWLAIEQMQRASFIARRGGLLAGTQRIYRRRHMLRYHRAE